MEVCGGVERGCTLSQPSKAQSPAYKATAQLLMLCEVLSNQPCFFQSWFASPR